ncbi:hypothetical protein BSQ39_05260 [Loigolactobacillus backii]|uniref:NAD-dependent epimerase/dehydratase family protein n=1 Tax=Loigolactobacillus backii TaxID=375175 RepID=UPI000C1CACF8|nr:NAD-dependent epimerase/dehydratase family protein [Loigolactobacillus backii]PIO83021.1 hypothetical protein BSQ39_05260 [Loigolactobacillus backii]
MIISFQVSGNNPKLPKQEMDAVDPLTPYAIDKYATERFVINYGRLYDIPTVAVRFFNVYGPRQNPKSPYSGVLSLISEAAIHHAMFTVFGDGEQTRDFVFVKDVIQALILLTKKTDTMHAVFNVGTGHETSLNEVIKAYTKIVQHDIPVRNLPERTGDIKRSVADVSSLEAIGYRSNYDLTTGLGMYWQSLS